MIQIMVEKFEAIAYDDEKLIGRSQYREEGDIWTIYHTEVQKSYGGQGIAGRLLDSIVEEAGKKGKKIYPECSFARHAFEKDREKYSDISVL